MERVNVRPRCINHHRCSVIIAINIMQQFTKVAARVAQVISGTCCFEALLSTWWISELKLGQGAAKFPERVVNV